MQEGSSGLFCGMKWDVNFALDEFALENYKTFHVEHLNGLIFLSNPSNVIVFHVERFHLCKYSKLIQHWAKCSTWNILLIRTPGIAQMPTRVCRHKT